MKNDPNNNQFKGIVASRKALGNTLTDLVNSVCPVFLKEKDFIQNATAFVYHGKIDKCKMQKIIVQCSLQVKGCKYDADDLDLLYHFLNGAREEIVEQKLLSARAYDFHMMAKSYQAAEKMRKDLMEIQKPLNTDREHQSDPSHQKITKLKRALMKSR